MENAERVEETIQNYDDVITNLFNDHIRNHTIQFFRKTGADTFVPEGTGVLIYIYDVFCVFTNGHVTENTDDFKYLYFHCGSKKYISCTESSIDSDVKEKIKHPDVDYIKLDRDVVHQLLAIGKQFLHLDKILLDHEGQQTKQYAIFGYPPDYVNQDEDKMKHDGLLFTCTMANDQPYDPFIYKKDTHYILPYTNPINMSTGAKTNTRHLYDMRGSGLWYIPITKKEDNVEYDYHLIGIMKEYYQHKRAQYIVANKIHLITDQIQSVISYK